MDSGHGPMAGSSANFQKHTSNQLELPRRSLMNIQVNNSMQRLTPISPPSSNHSRNDEQASKNIDGTARATYDDNRQLSKPASSYQHNQLNQHLLRRQTYPKLNE